MAIGEFGAAPPLPVAAGPVVSNGMYWLYEMSHAALNPARAFADVTRLYLKNPLNPLVAYHVRQDGRGVAPKCSSASPAATASPTGISTTPWSAASVSMCISRRSGSGRSAGCCISSAC